MVRSSGPLAIVEIDVALSAITTGTARSMKPSCRNRQARWWWPIRPNRDTRRCEATAAFLRQTNSVPADWPQSRQRSPFRATAAFRVDHIGTPHVPATLKRLCHHSSNFFASFWSGRPDRRRRQGRQAPLCRCDRRSARDWMRESAAAVFRRSTIEERIVPALRQHEVEVAVASRSPMLTLADSSDVVSRLMTVVKPRGGATRCPPITRRPTITTVNRCAAFRFSCSRRKKGDTQRPLFAF